MSSRSLIMNLSTNTVVKLIIKKWILIEGKFKIPQNNFLEILKLFIFENNYFLSYFQHENIFEKQIYGLGMGNCLTKIFNFNSEHSIIQNLKCRAVIIFNKGRDI